jgi:hypothetical protein
MYLSGGYTHIDTKNCRATEANQSALQTKPNSRKRGEGVQMARTISRAKGKEMGITITPKMGCWIKYQLNLRNIVYATVAREANRSDRLVCEFIRGRKNSLAVKAALCKVLGYETFEKLIAASRGKGGAV